MEKLQSWAWKIWRWEHLHQAVGYASIPVIGSTITWSPSPLQWAWSVAVSALAAYATGEVFNTVRERLNRPKAVKPTGGRIEDRYGEVLETLDLSYATWEPGRRVHMWVARVSTKVFELVDDELAFLRFDCMPEHAGVGLLVAEPSAPQ